MEVLAVTEQFELAPLPLEELTAETLSKKIGHCMPCIFAFLALAFPRVAIVLLFLFTNFFAHIFPGIVVPVIGFLFLPLTLLVYAYLLNIHAPMGAPQLALLLIAVILDLGLVGGGTLGRRRRIA